MSRHDKGRVRPKSRTSGDGYVVLRFSDSAYFARYLRGEITKEQLRAYLKAKAEQKEAELEAAHQ